MCGFCGFILGQTNISHPESKKTIVEMNNALVHRGPDQEGYEILKMKKYI